MTSLREPLELRPVWKRLFPSPLALALLLFLALAALRAYGYLGSDLFHGTPVLLGFLVMWILPSLFLTPYGREQIGLESPLSLKWISLGILAGAALSALCYLLGILLYGKTDQNWFVSIAYTVQTDERIDLFPRHIALLVFALPAVLASPIGEEFFFRGFLEQSNRHRFAPAAAACFAAALFALVHLVHHGIYRSQNGLEIMPLSGSIWFALMFATSLLFSFLRRKSDSLWPAVAAHAAFNLVMYLAIFYSLLVTHPQTIAVP